MKFCFVLVVFLIICKIVSSSQVLRSKALQKAFVKVSESLAQRNHLVSVVSDEMSSVSTDSAPFASIASVPHTVTKFDKSRKFQLNSSSIVLLDSFKSLETFNKQTMLPQSFTIF